jgi:hypothetical protein
MSHRNNSIEEIDDEKLNPGPSFDQSIHSDHPGKGKTAAKANNIVLVNNFLNLIRRPLPKIAKMTSAVPSTAKNVVDLKMPIKAAIKSGNFLFANELKLKGFCIAPTLIFESIYKRDLQMINNIVNHSLYSYLNIDLAFWFLLKKGFLDQARNLWEKESTLHKYCESFVFSDPETLERISNESEFTETAFDQALKYGIDEAACMLVRLNLKLLSIDSLTKALESGCVNLLKIVWSGDLQTDPEKIVSQRAESEIWNYLTTSFSDVEEVQNMRNFMKASYLIKYYLDKERYNEVKKIISWSMLKNSLKILNMLIESNNSELTKDYILNSGIRLTTEQFVLALTNEKYDVCYTMLKVYKFSLEIKNKNIHKLLIGLIENSSTCLLAVEILNRIKRQYWTLDYTRDLCLTLSTFIKKRQEIAYCGSPLLFCVLVLELMKNLSKYSTKYSARCNNTSEIYMSLGVCIEECLVDEDSLKHYMIQKDSLGRTVLEIIAKHEFYQLLEDDNVGVLVTKLWVGSENYYSFYHASSIVTTVLAPSGSEESLQFTKGIDMARPYNFQLAYLRESCGSRIFSNGLAILALIILYKIFLYNSISSQSILEIKSGTTEASLFGIIVTIIFGISCEQILGIMYSLKTRGKIRINMWKINDWVIGLLVIFISAEIPLKAYKNGWVEYESAYLGSGILHSIMLALIVTKFGNIMMTNKSIGPFISMTLLIFNEIYTFFVIVLGIALCSSAIFTLLFEATSGYQRLDLSFRTLYMATIGPFVINSFAENKVAFGAVMLAIFLLMFHVLLLNLLVGIVTNVFTVFQQRIESEHRSVLITRYYEDRWNDDCGVLVMLPPPANALALITSPLVLIKNSERNNRILSNIFYCVYLIPYFVLFIAINFLAIPVAYLEGFIIIGRVGKEVPEEAPVKIFDIAEENPETALVKKFSYLKSIEWTFTGIPRLFYAFFRDCGQFWKLAYLNLNINQSEVSTLVDETFIRSFHKVLSQCQAEFVTISDFFNSFKELDKIFVESSEERNEDIRLFISQFSHPDLEGKIDCAKIKSLFPKVTGGNYDESYIDRFKYFRLPYIFKGIRIFQKKVGSTSRLRKMRGNKKDQGEKFFKEVEQVEESIGNLKAKMIQLNDHCVKMIGNQKKDENLIDFN